MKRAGLSTLQMAKSHWSNVSIRKVLIILTLLILQQSWNG